MHPNDAPLISDPIMQSLLQMLKTSSGKTSAVQEDALVAIGTLVEGMCAGFPFLILLIRMISSFGITFSQVHRSFSSISLRSIE